LLFNIVLGQRQEVFTFLVFGPTCPPSNSESCWNVMAHVDAREGKWRGNWRMELVASTLHTTSEHGYPALLPLMRTPRLPVVNWTDVPADLNGLVRFAERRNLVSARVPSHYKRSLPRVKRAGRDIDHCLPSSTEVKNEWGCTATTLIGIMVSPGIIYCCEHGVWSKRVKEKFSFLLCRLYYAVYLMALPGNGHSFCQSDRP